MKENSILGNKIYLYLTEFFAGMAVMAVELGASRLMAPYFSSSQIVWTIIIGTIMIAMALGNIYGGRIADKHPEPDRLYRRIMIAAIWIALIPVAGKYVILGISALLIIAINQHFLIWAAFLACMVIFVFPLFLLGTVTPSLAKYTMDNLEDNGKTVGTLGAFNTVGSILGTFLPTFVTIPSVGTAITFLIFAGILLLLSLIYFVSSSRKTLKSVKGIIAILLYVLCWVFGASDSFAFWESELTYEGESVYNYLQVSEDAERVILSTNVLFGVQSITRKDGRLTGMYYDYAMAAPLMSGGLTADSVHRTEDRKTSEKEYPQHAGTETAEPGMSDQEEEHGLDVLILGMGTGTFAAQCQKYFDHINTEGVEIDEKITGLAHRYFSLPEDIPVTTYDGRAYLEAVEKKYDVILVDAYQDITIPFQMSSVEFFRLVKEHLKEDGVMAVNMNMRGSREGNINQYLSDTISTVFSEVYTIDVKGSTNRELFASDHPGMMECFAKNQKNLHPGQPFARLMSEVQQGLIKYEPGEYLLTDDKAPVEVLGMRVIDEMIHEELGYYKALYQENGIEGLMDAFLE